jgi:hypothetical protein
MLAILLAAGLAAANRPPSSVEGRMALIEARQMLESQQVWQLRSELPPEVLKAIADVELHVQHDLDQEEKVRDLTRTVAQLQERLAAVELLLQQTAAIESTTRIPVMQVQPLEVPAKPAARKAQKRPAAEKKPHQQAGRRAHAAAEP